MGLMQENTANLQDSRGFLVDLPHDKKGSIY